MIELKKVKKPICEAKIKPVFLTDETLSMRKEKILAKMKTKDVDALVIWGDLEHGSNFEYLVGFLPRFEEALLVLHASGKAELVLGNENLNKAKKSRIPVTAIHMPHFSLPNQPMEKNSSVPDILRQCKLNECKKIGLVGWKNFTSKADDNTELFDLPYYVVEAIKSICPQAILKNATYFFIGNQGARTINNANEFAHYEFGAALAGNCMLQAMEEIDVGKSEMEVANSLDAYGQRHSVVTIMASGERFIKANMYPTNNLIKKGDTISITTGFKGGLQSRGGYAVKEAADLPSEVSDYLDVVAKPYYQAVVEWLEKIHIGMTGNELYEIIQNVLPKEKYGWSLNPGHLCADEEWLSSPIYQGSKEILQSGMLLQIDIIPSIKGYGGISCESSIMLADEEMRTSLKQLYPELWKRVVSRRAYMRNELGINISNEIIPTSIATAFCRPFLLDKDRALVNKE